MVIEVNNPPLLRQYAALKRGGREGVREEKYIQEELPVIDVSALITGTTGEKEACGRAICRAASEWGFFQVVNHGISDELLGKMRSEQVKLFKAPFERKVSNTGLLNNSYRWGTPTATCPVQFSWSEAFHVPLTLISTHHHFCYAEFTSLREVLEEYAASMQELARQIAEVLVMNIDKNGVGVFEQECNESTCFLRLNRYPPCPYSPEVYGLVPHTDSDFLTILHQDDKVGGLQLMKGSEWISVKPHSGSLVVNIGDLFQAWSNDMYKSVEHKVMANGTVERHSIAYFLCPFYDSVIESTTQPCVYKKFTFGEYRNQIQQDVKATGHKFGLARYIL